ncbi:MAG TPA: hypothetical protein VFR41_11595, partial [Acidimicrobiia bacterium]|nr:hypothetical protein [Acidimicrobiia bacterium]
GWYRNPVRVAVSASDIPPGYVPQLRCVLDPAVAPTSFLDLPPGDCPYASPGLLVTANGHHHFYAMGRDNDGNDSPLVSKSFDIDASPPTVTCDGTGPASFTIGAPDGILSATVTDSLSGPDPDPANGQTTLDASHLATAGNRTATVIGKDLAGNQTSVSCAYQVGYDVDVVAPVAGASFKNGATVAVTFRLRDDAGNTISDAAAAQLAGGKRSPCFITALFDDVAQKVCPTYAAATDVFTLNVKTPKGRSVIGTHDIAIQIKAPDGTGIVNLVRIPIILTT